MSGHSLTHRRRSGRREQQGGRRGAPGRRGRPPFGSGWRCRLSTHRNHHPAGSRPARP